MQRDIFVFQTLIGCRVSDLYALTRNNIINDAVEYIAGKTVDGNPRTIRVSLNKGNSIFPFTAQQDYNEDITEDIAQFSECQLLCGLICKKPTIKPLM